MSSFKGRVAIVGYGEVPTGKFPERHCLESALEVCRQAILESGIHKDEIDTVIPTGTFFDRRYNTDMIFSKLVEELGLLGKARNNFQVFAGGSSSSTMLKTACGLIHAGLSKVILCVQSDRTGSAPVQEMINLFATFGIPEEWETPFGFFMAASGSLFATRYMHETGTTPAQLASVVVSNRKWAALNPNAMLRREVTVEEVLGSKMVATPLTAKEGNILADGAAAFIVTSAERAKDLPNPPVYPLGFGSRVCHYALSQNLDLTRLGFYEASREAYQMSGIGPRDIDIVEIYDGYPIFPLITLEGLGVCARGEAGAFVHEGKTWPGGRLPMTTNGGMLGQGHTAAGGGVAVLVEAIRQLMGKAGQRQVRDAKIAVETSLGGTFMDSHVVVLGREVP
ncbi:MAG: thiolase family protein [Acidobacteriota bacterium]